MTQTMVTFDAATRTLQPRASAPQPLAPGEVRVEVTCCTICGSDLHTFTGRRSAPSHCVLGHEIIGRVVEWHEKDPPHDFLGQPLQAGQRVTWAMAVGCGDCFYCKRGVGQKCERLFKYGHESLGCHPTGGLSETCVLVPGTPIFAIPDRLADNVACPANCATATVTAALRLVAQTHTIEGASVLVIGAGMLGLTATAQFAERGAQTILVADPDAERLDLAGRFGATNTVSARDPSEVVAVARESSAGRGTDIAVDFAGVPSAVQTALAAVRIGGNVLLAGSTFPIGSIEIEPEQWVRRMLTVRGLHNYLPGDLLEALRFLERTAAKYPFDALVSRSFPLAQSAAAFQFALQHRPVRVAVHPAGNQA